jgi:carbon-monoxide dehydrogenase medium subunit
VNLPRFEFHAPRKLEEVFDLLERLGPAARIMAGGTDLIRALGSSRVRCEHVVSLGNVAELAEVRFDEKRGLMIGAATVLADVACLPATREMYPAFAAAIDGLATVQVRHKGTVVGNLCNASPCADTAPPLMALGARATIAGSTSSREILVEDLITGPGQTVLEPTELVIGVSVPPPANGLRSTFIKFSPRSRVDISAVSVAVTLTLNRNTIDDVNLFLGTVAPRPMRASRAEKVLKSNALTDELLDRAAQAARKECRPITDFRATKEYKEQMVQVLTRRALEAVTRAA